MMSVSEVDVLSNFGPSGLWSNRAGEGRLNDSHESDSPRADAAPRILTAQSTASDTRRAAREFYAAVAQPDMALVMFFCSVRYDLDIMAAELQRLFAGVQVVGCTTAGEIGPVGCLDHSISGASFPAGSFTVASGHLDGLQHFLPAQAHTLSQQLLQKVESREPRADSTNTFAYLLIDGLSVREEQVSRAVQNVLGTIPVVGGSAGDGLRFSESWVYSDGVFRTDSAVLVMVTTMLPFRTFKADHFIPSDERVVVTRADAARRIVHEIDGRPAVESYARLVGVPAAQLTRAHFAERPMVVMVDGAKYVRAIQQANVDGSLTFYCAIEEGLVLRAARGVGVAENLESTFADLEAAIGRPQLVVGCDCILRKVEVAQRGVGDRVSQLFRDNNVVGFNGYGEQFRGVHVSQTLTGIAIGEASHF